MLPRPALKCCACAFLVLLICQDAAAQSYLFTTIAGMAGVGGTQDGQGGQARFSRPSGIAVAPNGDIYVTDVENHTIRRITPAGFVTTIAGQAGVPGRSDGPGATARFRDPWGIAVDSQGNVYVADTGNAIIRKIDTQGIVTTIAGTPGVSGMADGSGLAAQFTSPSPLALDNNGMLLVGDLYAIRKVSPEGIVTTLAGKVIQSGFVNGTGAQARFSQAYGIAVDDSGTIYVADSGNLAVRKLTPAGIVTTVASGMVYPSAIASDTAGNLFVLDGNLRRIGPNGTIATLSGGQTYLSVDGIDLDAHFYNYPSGLALDKGGNLYVGGGNGRTVSRVTPFSGRLIRITAEPQSGRVYEGLATNLLVSATSSAPLFYQWQLEGRDIPGATNPALLLNPVQLSDAGHYSVIVRSADATLVSAPAELRVTPTSTPGAVDLGFDPGAGADGEVDAAILQPDGRIIIAGIFSHVNHISRPGIARLQRNGNLDLSFDPGLGFEGPLLRDRLIQFLALLPDGQILVGGEFIKFNGATVPGAVRLNSDGKLDTTLQLPNGVSGLLAAQPDGRLITRWPVTRVNPDGILDPTFQRPPGLSASSTIFPNAKRALVLRSGKILLVQHTSNDPTAETSVISILNSDGTPDTLFSNNLGTVSGSGSPVFAETFDGKLIIGWGLNVTRYLGDGRPDPDFSQLTLPGVFSAVPKVWTLAPQIDGKIIVGGIFQGNSWSCTRVNQNGSIDVSFAPVIRYRPQLSASFCCFDFEYSEVRSLAIQPDGYIVVAGKLNLISDLPRWYVGRLVGNAPIQTPQIGSSPADTIVFAGQTVSFTVRAFGPALTYQWLFNGTKIANATNATLVLNSVRFEDGGKYSVVISNSFGTLTSDPGTLSVLPPALPVIVVQPKSQTANDETTVAISVIATNASSLAPAYQWQFNGITIPTATNSTLRLNPVHLADSGIYTVVVSNIAGAVTSQPSTLTILPVPPSIIVQPASQTLIEGTNLSLNVTVDGTPPFGYQWRRNDVDLPGQTNASLQLQNVGTNDSGTYKLIVSNRVATISSAAAFVTVKSAYLFSTVAGLAGVAGTQDGTGSEARFVNPAGIVVDKNGIVYVVDERNFTIRKILPNGAVSTLAGQARSSGSADGQGSNARFWFPMGLTMDGNGNLYVADGANYTVRKVAPDGTTTTLAGSPGVSQFQDGTGAGAHFHETLWLAADRVGNVYEIDGVAIRKITADGVVTTVAGSYNQAGNIDGPRATARFGSLGAIAVGQDGAVYVSDNGNHTLRALGSDGIVRTIGGVAGTAGSVDGKAASAQFYGPGNIAFDGQGNLFMTDGGAVRKMTADGIISTLGGDALTGGSADGLGPVARFNSLGGIAVDASGNIYLSDMGNDTIRKGTPFFRKLAILSQPHSADVIVGATATFQAAASGTIPPHYQWRKNGADLSGQNSPSLVLSPVAATDAGTFDVVVSDSTGSITSDPATLNVLLHPVNDFFAQAFVLHGTNDSSSKQNFSATKEAGEPNHAGNSGGKSIWWTWTVPTNGLATFDTYGSKIPTMLAAYSGTSVSGLTVAASNSVTVTTVTNQISFNVLAGQTYQIVVDGYGGAEGDVVLNLKEVGSAPMTNGVQALIGHWTFDESSGTNIFDSAGTNHGSLSGVERIQGRVGAGALRFDGSSSFALIGGIGTALELAGTPFTLACWIRPSTDARLESVIDKGANRGYGVALEGPTLLNYRSPSGGGSVRMNFTTEWQHIAVTFDGRWVQYYLDFSDGGGMGGGVPSFLNADPSDPLIFGAGWTSPGFMSNFFRGDLDDVRIYNYVLSDAELQELAAASGGMTFEIVQQPSSQTVLTGGDVTLAVAAVGAGAVHFQWYFGVTPLPGATNTLLRITNAQASNAGAYHVVLSGNSGSVTSSNAVLTVVSSSPTITVPLQSQIVSVGTNVTFSVTALGFPPLHYNWRFTDLHSFTNFISWATNSTLVLTNVQTASSGFYFVYVIDSNDRIISSEASLTVSSNNVPLSLNATANVSNGTIDLTIQGVVGKSYRIEASSNLLNWTSMATTNFTGTNTFLRDILPRAAAKRFYRAVQE